MKAFAPGYDPRLITERGEVYTALRNHISESGLTPIEATAVDEAGSTRLEQAMTFMASGLLYHVIDPSFIPPEGYLSEYAMAYPRGEEEVIDGIRYPLFGDPLIGHDYHLASEKFKAMPAITFAYDIREAGGLHLRGIDRMLVTVTQKVTNTKPSAVINEIPEEFSLIYPSAGDVDKKAGRATREGYKRTARANHIPVIYDGLYRPRVTAPIRRRNDFVNMQNLVGGLFGEGLVFAPEGISQEAFLSYQSLLRVLSAKNLARYKVPEPEFARLIDFSLEPSNDGLLRNTASVLQRKNIWQHNNEQVTVANLDSMVLPLPEDYADLDAVVVRLLQKIVKVDIQKDKDHHLLSRQSLDPNGAGELSAAMPEDMRRVMQGSATMLTRAFGNRPKRR